jgi:hypothetical protein
VNLVIRHELLLESGIKILGMSRLIGTADKSADIWRFQNNR